MEKFNLTISTPRGINYNSKVSIITLKVSEGYIGIQANRIPFISSVKVGKFSIKEEDGGQELAGVFQTGMIQSKGDIVTIVVKDVIWYSEIEEQIFDKEIKNLKNILIKEESKLKRQKIKNNIAFYELALEGN